MSISTQTKKVVVEKRKTSIIFNWIAYAERKGHLGPLALGYLPNCAKQEQNDKSNCRVIACEYLKRMMSFDLNLVFSTDKFNMIAIRGKMAEVLRKQSE